MGVLKTIFGSSSTDQKSQICQPKPKIRAFALEKLRTPSGLVDGFDEVDLNIDLFPDLEFNQTDEAELPESIIEPVTGETPESQEIYDVSWIEGGFEGEDIEDIPFITNLQSEPVSYFESGVFTVGDSREVGFEFLFDGGNYQGELAIFNLEGMEEFDFSNPEEVRAFMAEASERALSDSEMGHIVISDEAEGAKFSATLPEGNLNSGDYLGVKTVEMNPGDKFALMIVPKGTVQKVYNLLDAGKDLPNHLQPLFSLSTANPDDAFHFGQIADVTGDGNTFALEDLRMDGNSDRDYNDIVFQVRGATGDAVNLDEVINPDNDWRQTDIGQELIAYAEASIIPEVTDLEFPRENQPLVGFIDTGIAADNPDLDYSNISLGTDRVAGDDNPLLQSGEGNEHGTHVVGIVGATQGNGVGIDGINDNAPLWVGRAVGSGKWAESLVEFVDVATESAQPNAVVNLSVDLTQINPDGSTTTRYEFTPFEREAIEYARQHGVLIVASAGNDGSVMSVLGQASQEFDNIITVGAADGLERAEYSSYGNGLNLLAEGGTNQQPVLSTAGNSFGFMSGTSVATARVTGGASLVWAANPELSYRQVIDILTSTATDLDVPGWDTETGAGLLNIAKAVKLAKVTLPEVYEPEPWVAPDTWSGEGLVTPGERPTPDSGFIVTEPPDVQVPTDAGEFINTVVSNGVTQHNYTNGYLMVQPNGSETWYELGSGTPLTNVNNFYQIGGQIWEKFLQLGGVATLGYPQTNEIPLQGGSVQNFQGGSKIWLSQHGAYSTWGAIGVKYDQLGGSNSWLGFPTSDAIPLPDNWVRQDFENGYLLWNAQSWVTAYQTNAIDTLPPDSGNSSTSNWHAQYWNNRNLVGSPQWSQYEDMSDLRFHAGWGAPEGTRGIPEENFGGRWITTSYFDGGIYNFINNADDGVRVYVDGKLIINKWTDSPFEEKRAYAAIEPGYHQVMVEYFEHQVVAANLLRWEPINTPQAWSGEVFNNVSLAGSPEGHLTDNSNFIDRNWGLGSVPDLLVPPDRWGIIPGKANDISVGADGSIWVIGATPVAGGYNIHRWTGNSWQRVDGGATEIAVAPDGTPWVVNDQGNIYRRVGNQWQQLPGLAKDISIGADGSVWIVGTNPSGNGYGIYHWDGQSWQEVGGAAVRITVAPDGTPWVVNSQGQIYKRIGDGWNEWQLLPGSAKDLEIGADGSVWAIGVRGSDASNQDQFSDRWATTRYFDEPGVYEFTSFADDGVRVWVDDQLVIDQWHDQPGITNKVLVPLDQGYHRLRVEHFENTGAAVNKFTWQKVAGQPNYLYTPGGDGDGVASGWLQPWTAEYFNNRNLQGAPVVTRLENNTTSGLVDGFNVDWRSGSPDSQIPNDNFSSRFTAHRYFPAGTYTFQLQGDDGMRFYINGENIIDRWTNPPFVPQEVEVTLPEGIHNLVVEHSENSGLAYANLDWSFVSNALPYTIAPELQAAHAEFETTLGEGAVGIPISDLQQYSYSPTPPPGQVGSGIFDSIMIQEFRGTQGRGALFQVNDQQSYYIPGELWAAYQQAGGINGLGVPLSTQDLGNGAYELELPKGRLFWAPGMTNPTYYEYAEATPATLTIPADAWRGEYFDNRNWAGDPVVVRQDSITDDLVVDWQLLPGQANDISMGADGSLWVIGATPVAGGYSIHQWTGNNWQRVAGGATEIAVAPNGTPWVVNDRGNIYQRVGNQWQKLPGIANDISIGADGSVWVIGNNPVNGGYGIHRWNGQNWQEVGGGAVRVTVAPDGTPWVVNDQGKIFRRVGNQWQQLPGSAKDIEIGADGSIWAIGDNPVNGGYGIYLWDGQGWQEVNGGATRVTVSPDGKPLVVNQNGRIFYSSSKIAPVNYSLDKSWGLASPAPGVPADDFSVRWTSNRPFDRGTYRFIGKHDDGFVVEVNGQKPIDKMIPIATQTTGYATFTRSGQYPIQVLHREYGGSATAKLNYEKASDFVVGLDGSNNPYQAIIDAFNRNGGYDRVGVPINNVYPWGNGVVQNFDYGANGRGVLIKRHDRNTAYYIFGKIWDTYLAQGGLGKYGYPVGDAHDIGNGIIYQPFEHGYIQIMPNGQVREHTYNYKEFVGLVMPGIGVAHRYSPNLHHRTGGATGYNQWLTFDAWTYGDTVTDTQLGTPDNRWFRIKGTNTWVPSGYIFGNPEGLPGGGGSGGGSANNGGPITSYDQYIQRLYGHGNGVITQSPNSDHNAIDSVNQGQYPYKVYSLTGGVVKFIGTDQYGGKFVRVWNEELKRSFIYLHFNSFNPDLKVGQTINSGHYLGNEGWTGNTKPKGSGGRHTHVHVLRPDGVKENPFTALGKLSSGNSGDEKGSYEKYFDARIYDDTFDTIIVPDFSIVSDFSKFDWTLSYMYQEMINNINSIEARELADLINKGSLVAASLLWISLVGTKRKWDHKPILARNLGLYGKDGDPKTSDGDDIYFPIRGDVGYEYSYDIWSNIHYGYVGSYVGFDSWYLQLGADISEGFNGVNDSGDMFAVQIGIDLWNRYGLSLETEHIHQEILNYRNVLNRITATNNQ